MLVYNSHGEFPLRTGCLLLLWDMTPVLLKKSAEGWGELGQDMTVKFPGMTCRSSDNDIPICEAGVLVHVWHLTVDIVSLGERSKIVACSHTLDINDQGLSKRLSYALITNTELDHRCQWRWSSSHLIFDITLIMETSDDNRVHAWSRRVCLITNTELDHGDQWWCSLLHLPDRWSRQQKLTLSCATSSRQLSMI